MKLYSKQELIEEMRKIFDAGWHKSVKKTIDRRNDGAVGNTLEKLLGISENNLPIPNAREWELKGQRKHTTALITLKHAEPSPTAARIVSSVLLPKYGWKHKKAGTEYPASEQSFRSTTSATSFTNRGFRVVVDSVERKVKFVFEAEQADQNDKEIVAWLSSVLKRGGLEKLEPEPYWGFDDLEPLIATKMKNCFYIVAASRIQEKREWFKYESLYVLSGFSFERFLAAIKDGSVLVDFDARTHHNHGTKFRLRQGKWPALYSDVTRVI